MSAPTAVAAATRFRFKFLFANHDGVSVELDFGPEATGLEMKLALLDDANWPAEAKNVEKPAAGTGGLRLLCMGKMLDDSRQLKDCKLPHFEHATPVNVSLMPKAKGTYSEAGTTSTLGKKDDSAPASSPGGGGGGGGQNNNPAWNGNRGGAGSQPNNNNNNACCIIC